MKNIAFAPLSSASIGNPNDNLGANGVLRSHLSYSVITCCMCFTIIFVFGHKECTIVTDGSLLQWKTWCTVGKNPERNVNWRTAKPDELENGIACYDYSATRVSQPPGVPANVQCSPTSLLYRLNKSGFLNLWSTRDLNPKVTLEAGVLFSFKYLFLNLHILFVVFLTFLNWITSDENRKKESIYLFRILEEISPFFNKAYLKEFLFCLFFTLIFNF